MLIVQGLACRHATQPDGRRQISGFLCRGDICNLEACLLNRPQEAVTALSSLETITLSRIELLEVMDRFPAIVLAFWRLTLAEQAITRQWMMNLTCRSAFQATAHLLCEVFTRLKAAGLSDGDSCDLHMTQADLADCLGLTSVHVNRTLMQLRKQNIISLHNRRLVVRDFPALKVAGCFKADYLQLPAASFPRLGEVLEPTYSAAAEETRPDRSPGPAEPARQSTL